MHKIETKFGLLRKSLDWKTFVEKVDHSAGGGVTDRQRFQLQTLWVWVRNSCAYFWHWEVLTVNIGRSNVLYRKGILLIHKSKWTMLWDISKLVTAWPILKFNSMIQILDLLMLHGETFQISNFIRNERYFKNWLVTIFCNFLRFIEILHNNWTIWSNLNFSLLLSFKYPPVQLWPLSCCNCISSSDSTDKICSGSNFDHNSDENLYLDFCWPGKLVERKKLK